MGIMDGDILSHRVLKNELAARKLEKITEHNGQQELYWDIVFSIAEVSDIPLVWKGVDWDDVNRSFKIWLSTIEDPEVDGAVPWHTIQVEIDGAPRILTFRGDWVAGFKIKEKGRARA
jgi:hypothetical protein